MQQVTLHLPAGLCLAERVMNIAQQGRLTVHADCFITNMNSSWSISQDKKVCVGGKMGPRVRVREYSIPNHAGICSQLFEIRGDRFRGLKRIIKTGTLQ